MQLCKYLLETAGNYGRMGSEMSKATKAATRMKTAAVDELVSTKGAGEILGGISARTVENMIRRGQLESVKMGGRRLIRMSELAAFIRGL